MFTTMAMADIPSNAYVVAYEEDFEKENSNFQFFDYADITTKLTPVGSKVSTLSTMSLYFK